MTYLLDVNVLIALIDRDHVMHSAAQDWFARTGFESWATCPITENGVLRILGDPRYERSPGSPAVVAELMTELLAHPGHEFWQDSVSLTDPRFADIAKLGRSEQVTDTYLLALAALN